MTNNQIGLGLIIGENVAGSAIHRLLRYPNIIEEEK
jgi:hypothetical protein